MVALTGMRPPGPPSWFPGGQMFAFRRNPLTLMQHLARYGDVVRYTLGGVEVFLVSHPDYIRDVLVTNQRAFAKGRGLQWARYLLGDGLLTSEGAVHRRQRRLMQPAFHRAHLDTYGPVMTDYAARLQQRWQDGAQRDMAQEMLRLTLGIAGKTLFDADVEEEAPDVGEALAAVMELFPRFMLPWNAFLKKLPLPSNRRADTARERLDTLIYAMIRERRASRVEKGDLLSMLLRAQDDEGDGGGMSDQQLRDEVMTLFLASHETTANMLTWTWYLLSQHPAAEARLHAELAAVLAGRLPTVADLPQLPYTRMVLAESLRLYPPAWILGRRALEACTLGDYVIPAGAGVTMCPYVVHRDPRYYDDPEAFEPQRWASTEAEQRPKFAYFPFGGGARQCIGEGFAWMEGVLVLATLAQSWQLRLAPGHSVAPKALITLRPRHGMPMSVHRRTT